MKENHILNLQIENFKMKNKTMEEKVVAMDKQIDLLENINKSISKDLTNLQKTYMESFINQTNNFSNSNLLLEKKIIENLPGNSLFSLINRHNLGTQQKTQESQNTKESVYDKLFNFQCGSCRTHHMYLDNNKLQQFDNTINKFFEHMNKERNLFEEDYKKVKEKAFNIKVTSDAAEIIFDHQDIISKLIMIIQNNMESYVYS